jgi:hypothetical protein
MSLLRWGKGGDSDQVTGLNWDTRLVGHCKIPAWQWAKLPRYWREGAVEVRPFPAKTRLRASEAQGLSGEAVKGNPTTTVIPGVDESKPSHRATDDSTEPEESLERSPESLSRQTTLLAPSVILERLPTGRTNFVENHVSGFRESRNNPGLNRTRKVRSGMSSSV